MAKTKQTPTAPNAEELTKRAQELAGQQELMLRHVPAVAEFVQIQTERMQIINHLKETQADGEPDD